MKTKPSLDLSIVMPCLNEAQTVGQCVDAAFAFIGSHHLHGEVVVGDNGSIDGSLDIARRHGARVIRVALRGYGAALFYATKASRGTYIIMGDSDGTYDFTKVAPLYKKLCRGNDLVMGNRFHGGIKKGAMGWINQYLGNPLLSGIGKLFFHCPINDFHSGLRGFTRAAFNRMDLVSSGMEYASEMVIKASLLGLNMSEVSISLQPGAPGRVSHLSPLIDGWRHLRFMLIYSPVWLFLIPGIIVTVSASALFIWVLVGPLHIGRIYLDVHTLTYSAFAMLIGTNMLTFYGFSQFLGQDKGLLTGRASVWVKIIRTIKVEQGIAIGMFLWLLGLGIFGAAFYLWDQGGFKSLNPVHMLRFVIPSGLCLALGSQIIFSSLLLGLLRLNVMRKINE